VELSSKKFIDASITYRPRVASAAAQTDPFASLAGLQRLGIINVVVTAANGLGHSDRHGKGACRGGPKTGQSVLDSPSRFSECRLRRRSFGWRWSRRKIESVMQYWLRRIRALLSRHRVLHGALPLRRQIGQSAAVLNTRPNSTRTAPSDRPTTAPVCARIDRATVAAAVTSC